MTSAGRSLLLGAMVVLVGACAGTSGASRSLDHARSARTIPLPNVRLDDGFSHPWYGYRVAPDPHAQHGALLEGWTLLGFRPDPENAGSYQPVVDSAYATLVEIDDDRDGVADVAPFSPPPFDVRFERPTTGGTVWVQTLPVGETWMAREPATLVDDVLRAFIGAHVRGFALPEAAIAHEGERVTFQRIDDNRASVDGMPAHAVTIDLVDVDRALVAPPGRLERARLVVVKTPYRFTRAGEHGGHGLPVILVLGCIDSVDAFDTALHALASIVDRFDAGHDQRGETHGITEPRTDDSTGTESPPSSP